MLVLFLVISLVPGPVPVEDREPGREGVLQSKNYYSILNMGKVNSGRGSQLARVRQGVTAEVG